MLFRVLHSNPRRVGGVAGAIKLRGGLHFDHPFGVLAAFQPTLPRVREIRAGRMRNHQIPRLTEQWQGVLGQMVASWGLRVVRKIT